MCLSLKQHSIPHGHSHLKVRPTSGYRVLNQTPLRAKILFTHKEEDRVEKISNRKPQ